MFTDILVPTDGSDPADAAVAYGERLATRYGADLHILSVVDDRGIDDAAALKDRRADRADELVGVRDDVETADLTVTDVARIGVPHEEILTYAEEYDVDLVVMGTHGRTGVERVLLGSVAERVVRTSPVPVLTVREGPDDDLFESVLVPTDGSETAMAAATYGLDIAGTYGARLTALSVVNTMTLGVDVRSAAMMDELEAAARDAVDQVAGLVGGADGDVETAIEYGQPARTIRAYAEEYDVDLVVMGTHGRTGIDRVLLGSVAERVVRTSPAPVLTVRNAPDDD